MTESQLAEIRNYLLDKKLPIDILMELQDHFVSQINALIREEDLSFEDAFEKVENNWHDELKPYWKGGLSLEDVSDFMRKMRWQIEKSNVLDGLKFSLPLMILIFVSAFVLNSRFFGVFVLAILVFIVGFALYKYIRNYKEFQITKKYTRYVLTLHQHSIFIFIIILSPMINITSSALRSSENFQKLFTFHYSLWESFFGFLGLGLVVFSVFYSISAQKNYLRQIEKVKPFLKYLKQTA